MSTVLSIALWCSLALVVYAYAGYAIAIAICARLFGRDEQAAEIPDVNLPFLSVLIAAHNEESVIGARLENALRMEYPADRLEIVIASDGSRDGTCEIVR